ncbi:FUSC family protein [Cupriavidus necator]|uniref:FUSC family protein n=1 Tax=Cupriavidus necator TaxID=106590 RepID=UPI0039C3ACD5
MDIRNLLFSLKTFVAAMLALYIALALGLSHPYWAMATVYFVSHPLTGATRSKAAYRVAGTLLGAAAAVATVPPLANMPIVLTAAVSIWIAALVYLSLLDRSPRGYVFLLAAYTFPIIALPAVGDPSNIFEIAVIRIEEIVIGIVCAAVVGALVLPAKVAPELRVRSAAWLAHAAQWGSEILRGSPSASVSRHHLAADVFMLEQLIVQLSFDAESAASIKIARAVKDKMMMLIPLLSSLDSVLRALRGHPKGIPTSLLQSLNEMSHWLANYSEGPRRPPSELFPAYANDATGWHGQLKRTAQLQLQKMATLFNECLALQQGIDNMPNEIARISQLPSVGKPLGHLHYDHTMLLVNSALSGLGVFLAGVIWIFSGWENGSSSVVVVAVACCFFATIHEPPPVALRVLRWSTVCLMVSSFYLFLVVPHAHTFEELVVMLALPYLAIGVLIAQLGFNLIAMMLAVNTALLANIPSIYDANYLGIFNANLAHAVAIMFAPVWAIIVRPIGSSVAAQRLVKATWLDLAHAASRRASTPNRLGPHMVDRLGQLVPSLAAGKSKLASDGFEELRLGFSVVVLQRAVATMPRHTRRPIRRVLCGVARHFRATLRVGHIVAPPSMLKTWVEDAMTQIDHLPTKLREDAFSALVVLRATLTSRTGTSAGKLNHDD